MNILVVDDEKATRSLFLQNFKEEIYQRYFAFSFVFSGEEALSFIEKNGEPSAVLILSDINMPGMSGLQLLKTLKAQYPHSAVMMVTSYGDEINHKKAVAYKADGFINKPIDFPALKDKILKIAEIQKKAYPRSQTLQKTYTPASKILVVDDEPALEALIRQKFRKQIKSGEMHFAFASNGLKALELIDQDPEIGIIITDINMPEMDGLALLARLKEMERLFRCVIISAYGDMENIRAAMNLGAIDFITKPIDLKDLEATLDKIIEQYKSLKGDSTPKSEQIEHGKEIEIASHIQKSFMPHNFDPFPGSNKIDIFGKIYAANEVSGDFFDFFLIGKDKLGFVIADVSGKGIPAALFMVSSKTLLRSTALTNPSPVDCLREVNHYLCYNNESVMYVTAVYGIIDINSGKVYCSDAGHLPPYILSSSGKLRQLKKRGGIALGVIDDYGKEETYYQEQEIQLEKGDSLIFYTDGVIETMNSSHEIYPVNRFEELIVSHTNKDFPLLINAVRNDLNRFSQGSKQYDDIALLCLRWNG